MPLTERLPNARQFLCIRSTLQQFDAANDDHDRRANANLNRPRHIAPTSHRFLAIGRTTRINAAQRRRGRGGLLADDNDFSRRHWVSDWVCNSRETEAVRDRDNPKSSNKRDLLHGWMISK